MAARKIDGHWYVDFRFRRARVRKQSPLNTRSGAEQYERALREELAQYGNLERLDPLRQKAEREKTPTFAEFAERWLRDYVDVNNKPSERRNKRVSLANHLVPTFGRYRLDEITPASVEAFKASRLTRRLSPKTINNLLAILRRCLVIAQEWELLAHVIRIRMLKVPEPRFRHLTTDEVCRLLDAAPEPRWQLMILIAVRTGMRFGELAGLTWDNIDLSRGVVHIRQAVVSGALSSPKNYRSRTIPLAPDLAQALIEIPGSSERFLFHGENGQPLHYSTAYDALQRTRKKAGASRLGWHIFRHTFASHLVQRGVPLVIIQQLLGHSDIKMTMRYSHVEAHHLRDAILALASPAGSWAAGGQYPLSKAPAGTIRPAIVHAERVAA
jgi:integrase